MGRGGGFTKQHPEARFPPGNVLLKKWKYELSPTLKFMLDATNIVKIAGSV